MKALTEKIMKSKLGIVMGPIAHINIKRKTPVSLCCWKANVVVMNCYMEMADLYLVSRRSAHRALSVEQNYDKWYEFGSEQEIKLADLDVILMRKDSAV